MPQTFMQKDLEPILEILLEDPAFLAVNKPAGQLFQGHTTGLPRPLDGQIKAYIREKKSGSDNVYLGIVHRLDRPVSGVSLFGLNSKFTSRLSLQFQAREVDKRYVAVLQGSFPTNEGELVDELADDDEEGGDTKACSLTFKVTERFAQKTLVEIKLGTGRRNQIRKQFSKRGFPIIGDKKFGAGNIFPGAENLTEVFRPIALHAYSLGFKHPKTQEAVSITAPLPSFWRSLSLPNHSLKTL